MSLELWNAFATFGTFIVIAATAIAALVQLRHARGSNQIAAMAELQDASQTPEFSAAVNALRAELSHKLENADFRFQIAVRTARTSENQEFIRKLGTVGNFYEQMGLFVKMGLVDRDVVLNMYAVIAFGAWEDLAEVAAILRRGQNEAVWENFEYLAVLSQDWIAAHPSGTYPAGVRRFVLKDTWLEADKQYAASQTPA